MHNKFVIVDGETVETGGFNYTAARQRATTGRTSWCCTSPPWQQYAQEWHRLWGGGGGDEGKVLAPYI
jgi:phosphatidylserine/phosphatidylglycerophosphate/cardiolipin synthase-like enzyme